MSNKKLSCGTIIVNEFNEILMGRVTLTNPPRWDLPKGVIEENEEPKQTAIRECMEEFGLDISGVYLTEIGKVGYNNDKNLHLFMTFVRKDSINLESLHCSSYFNHYYSQEKIIEVDGYAWVPMNEIHEYTGPSMLRVLAKLYDMVENESKYGEYR